MVNNMLMNNRFSKKNSLLYKMKYINTRNAEYNENNDIERDREQRYNTNSKKWIKNSLFYFNLL